MTDRCTRITIETERMLIVARQFAVRAWCERCGASVEFLPSDSARRVFDATTGSLDQEQRSHFHKQSAKDGLMLICVQSLLRLLQTASDHNWFQK